MFDVVPVAKQDKNVVSLIATDVELVIIIAPPDEPERLLKKQSQISRQVLER
jgi:hypothetical protein